MHARRQANSSEFLQRTQRALAARGGPRQKLERSGAAGRSLQVQERQRCPLRGFQVIPSRFSRRLRPCKGFEVINNSLCSVAGARMHSQQSWKKHGHAHDAGMLDVISVRTV